MILWIAWNLWIRDWGKVRHVAAYFFFFFFLLKKLTESCFEERIQVLTDAPEKRNCFTICGKGLFVNESRVLCFCALFFCECISQLTFHFLFLLWSLSWELSYYCRIWSITVEFDQYDASSKEEKSFCVVGWFAIL